MLSYFTSPLVVPPPVLADAVLAVPGPHLVAHLVVQVAERARPT